MLLSILVVFEAARVWKRPQAPLLSAALANWGILAFLVTVPVPYRADISITVRLFVRLNREPKKPFHLLNVKFLYWSSVANL